MAKSILVSYLPSLLHKLFNFGKSQKLLSLVMANIEKHPQCYKMMLAYSKTSQS